MIYKITCVLPCRVMSFFFFKECLRHLIGRYHRGFHPYQLGRLCTAFFETKQCHQRNTCIFVLRPIQNVSEGACVSNFSYILYTWNSGPAKSLL